MTNKKLISNVEFDSAIVDILKTLEEQSGGVIQHQDLNDVVLFSLNKIKSDILDCEIKSIVDYSISELLVQWDAIVKLYPNDSMSLHCRKILECSMIIQFLLRGKNNWGKYIKKWELYKEVTMLSRWSRLDKNNLHPDSQRHFDLFSKQYSQKRKEYGIFFSSNKASPLTGNLLSDLEHFVKIKSWIAPRSFEDLLADKTKHSDQSQRFFYDWWSSSIHFSPLNQGFYKIETDFGDYSENAYLNIFLEISSFIKCVSKITRDDKYYFNLASSFFYIHLLKLVREKPSVFIEQVENHPQAFKALIALAAGQINASRYIELAIPKG